MAKGIQIITLEDAEKYFKIQESHQKGLDFAQKTIEIGYETYKSREENFPLTDQRKEYFQKRLEHLTYLLSNDVTVMDRIIAILKHMAWKTTLLDFKLIKNETDVIISYQIEDEPDIW